jgi:hypothetical protein
LRLCSTTCVRGSTTSSSTLATSLLSQRSPGEAALPSSLPRVPHRSTTVHAPPWRSPFGAFLLFLSSVAGSSCSPDARAEPNRTATGRRWPADCRAVPPCRHHRRQASSGSSTPPPSPLADAGSCGEHVGAITLAENLTSGEELPVSGVLCLGVSSKWTR